MIREYKKSDYEHLQQFMVKLQEYIISLDPLKRIYINETYKEIYTNKLLHNVKNNKGKIFIAEIDGLPVGMIAGIIKEPDNEEEYYIKCCEGKILEMYLNEDCRGSGLAQDLIKSIENYFGKNKCELIRIDVFSYNKMAEKFYSKCGYETRNIEMCKKIE